QIAQKLGTTIIRVVDNYTVIDEHLPGPDLRSGVPAANYLEAAGIVACMKAGVLLESVKTSFYCFDSEPK
ncbi:hypothetical protein LCGC14_2182880, partial [marine sediment metagenome]